MQNEHTDPENITAVGVRLERLVMLLNEAADELAYMHRERMERDHLAGAIPRLTRLLDKIKDATGHETDSPYPTAT